MSNKAAEKKSFFSCCTCCGEEDKKEALVELKDKVLPPADPRPSTPP